MSLSKHSFVFRGAVVLGGIALGFAFVSSAYNEHVVGTELEQAFEKTQSVGTLDTCKAQYIGNNSLRLTCGDGAITRALRTLESIDPELGSVSVVWDGERDEEYVIRMFRGEDPEE